MRLKVGFLSFFIFLTGCFSILQAASHFESNQDLKLESNPEMETVRDTAIALSEVAVVAHIKQKNDLRLEPLSSSVLKMGNIEREQVVSLNDFSYYTPNLYIPEYGSKMTSSIYIRGLGSRMDNPAVGLYVDNIPYLNKNGFDTDLWDIMRMEVLRGPQSTLYGRNTIGGIINIHTLSPMVYQGTRLSIGYGNGNTYSIKGSTYWKPSDKFAFSVGANYYSTDGFFTNINEDNNSNCDWIKGGSGRFRLVFKPSSRFTIDNSFMAGRVEQGGYAYSLYNPDNGQLNPVNYNDPSGYVRTTISNGLSLNYQAPDFIFSSVTSWQFLDDKMTLDQDFTANNMFTMQQAQKEHTITQDLVFKNNGEHKRWQWLTGLTLFYKNMKMDAPVRFKKDGIDGLILNNINGMFQGMPAPMNTAKLAFAEDEFDLLSNFDMPVLGAALYHQSQLSFGRFSFTAGLRFDYECAKIDYLSNSEVDYIYTMMIQMGPMLREVKVESGVNTLLQDKLKEHYFEVLPKFALQYSLENNGNLYASVSRGFKAGGYNTQMFSDILQNQVKTDLMADLMSNAGGSLGGAMGGGSGAGGPMGGSGSAAGASYTVQDIITYRPEYSWNYELGAHLNFFGGKLNADAALFYIDCTDQQLTVFPSGTTTGRMMTNAGHTRSYGAEMALNGKVTSGLDLAFSYGYTNAKFIKYNDGHNNYKGNYVPYVPQNTLNATAAYTFYRVGNFLDKLSFRAGYNGIGKIYWNEENSMSQDFYSLLNASIYAQKGVFSLEFWGKNLTNTDYKAFYFVSVGNTFFSVGKPAQYGVTLSFEF